MMFKTLTQEALTKEDVQGPHQGQAQREESGGGGEGVVPFTFT